MKSSKCITSKIIWIFHYAVNSTFIVCHKKANKWRTLNKDVQCIHNHFDLWLESTANGPSAELQATLQDTSTSCII